MAELRANEELGGPVRAIVVDDEKLGRQLVRNLSDATPLLRIIGEYANGRDAITAIRSTKPELVFLDIKMPDLNGLMVAREILDCGCLVVFVTAFEAHALEAFEAQAFDYLLKPIELERFETVVGRVHRTVRRIRLERALETKSSGTAGLPDRPSIVSTAPARIRIREGDAIRYIDTSKVIWFEAANQYVQVHAVSGSYLISTESLTSLQEKIDAGIFVRIHRSSIINVNYASRIRVTGQGVYLVEMSNGDRVRVSRSYRNTLKSLDI